MDLAPIFNNVIVWIVILVVLIYGILVFFGTLLQSLLFQRYRLQKNEAAMRKSRLHEEDEDKQRYVDELLGSVKEEEKK